jgi:hypothetical protein
MANAAAEGVVESMPIVVDLDPGVDQACPEIRAIRDHEAPWARRASPADAVSMGSQGGMAEMVAVVHVDAPVLGAIVANKERMGMTPPMGCLASRV